MSKNNGKVPGTYVSEKELNELGALLASFRDYIVSHEARLELIEAWIGEFHKHNSDTPEDSESPAEEAGATEDEGHTLPEGAVVLTAASDEEVWDVIEAQSESSNDTEEG